MYRKMHILNMYNIPQSQFNTIIQQAISMMQKSSTFIRLYAKVDNINWVENEADIDFLKLKEAYDRHTEEEKNDKKKMEFSITRRKYFQKTEPNFLFWNEKKQIQYLYNSNPEEWSIERLSESFPALPCTIKKIIKTNWVPESLNRIDHHDANVLKNWKLFRENKIDIESDIRVHLNKFSIRESRKSNSVLDDKLIETYNSEFGSLVKPECIDKISIFKQTSDLPSSDKKINQSNMTLHQFKERNKSVIGGLKQTCSIETSDIPSNNTKVLSSDCVSKDSFVSYPESINIPKKLWKKGFTYKINDCYYDDDGSFLYRVIGR